MKKTIFAFLCLSILLCGNNSTLNAASTLKTPKTISIGDAQSYIAGENVQMTFLTGERSVGNKTNVEYGVARAIKNGDFTTYEVITAESKDISNATVHPVISFLIPNPLSASDASSTYVAYIQYSEKNNQDNVSYYTSKEFSIVPNNTPFIQVRNINLLSSNGKRFFIKQGPSIYSPEEAQRLPGTATSTSLEITFESNQDMVLNPQITFTKIRSDVFNETISLPQISIKKGKTYQIISLPTFNYEPGVYIGKMTFGNSSMKKEVELQYIVAGNAVTIGTASVVEKEGNDSFKFEIFGSPLDFERNDPTTATTAPTEIHKVTTSFVNAQGKELFSTTQDVDFAGQEFSVEIPKKYKSIESINISVVSSVTGQVIFETSRNVSYTNPEAVNIKVILYILLYILFIVIGILAICKTHIKVAIFCIIVLIGLFFARNVFAVRVGFEGFRDKTAGNWQIMKFNNEGHWILPTLLVDDEVLEPTTCGEPVKVKFAVHYIRCTNTTPGIRVGFSRVDYLRAYQTNMAIGLGTGLEKVEVARNGPANNPHIFYNDVSNSADVTIAAVPQPESILYATVDVQPVSGGGNNTQTGYSRYQIPLKNTCGNTPPTCTCSGRTEVCTANGVETSRTVNSPSCALQASCTVNTSGTTATFNTIVTNAVGSVAYKDIDSGSVITNPYQRTVPIGSSITQRTLVTDTDNTTATAVCTATNINGGGGPTTSTSTPTGTTTVKKLPPVITRFRPAEPVVRKNQSCSYSWNVTGADRCALLVNNVNIPLLGTGLTGPAVVPTTDGNNQRALVTCVSDDLLPAPESTVSSTTLCQVLPEVIER